MSTVIEISSQTVTMLVLAVVNRILKISIFRNLRMNTLFQLNWNQTKISLRDKLVFDKTSKKQVLYNMSYRNLKDKKSLMVKLS